MTRVTHGCLIGSVAALLAAQPLAARLPGTLNFANVTSGNVVQTVVEAPPIEKAVDYGDFDNDGDLDVVVACAFSDFGMRCNKLYRNDGGVFQEISTTAFTGTPPLYGPGFTSADLSRSAFFRDYDNDGWLDMIIINDTNVLGDAGRTKIYMNQHPDGVFASFREEGAYSVNRLGNAGGPAGDGSSQDFDDDGDVDLYVGNSPNSSQDTMYFNNGNGFFSAVTSTHVPADSDYTVDVSSADLNGDLKLDLLVTNLGTNRIYLNSLSRPNDGPGDFSTANSVIALSPQGANENAMEPGDFDNDGHMDFYWSNGGPPGMLNMDRIRRNTGNNGLGQPEFVDAGLPPNVTNHHSIKATVRDLNLDGRMDVVVMSDVVRPTILRNTTIAAGAISFVDWTPGHVFPTGTGFTGWHAAAFDRGVDGYPDIFLGAFTNQDYLFDNVDSNEAAEAALPVEDGVIVLPPTFNVDPVAITGSVDGTAPDLYQSERLSGGANAFLSVILNGLGDFRLEVLDAAGAPLDLVNRGGLQIEEAVQSLIAPPGGSRGIRVTLLQAFADGDLDQDVDLADLALAYNCSLGSGVPSLAPGCERFDADLDTDVDLNDIAQTTPLILGPGAAAIGAYQLELLARN